MDKPLSDKQEAFCQSYCNNGFNASQAYKKVYNAKNGWDKHSAKLMVKYGIKERIKDIRAANKAENELTVELQRQVTINLRNEAQTAGNYSAALTANDQLNKHCGFYLADNEQQRERAELDEQQEADLQAFIAWKHRQMLRIG